MEEIRGAAAGDRNAARVRSLAYALQGRVWTARRDAARARAAWTLALEAIDPVARNTSDYQFLDPLAEALVALDRTSEAVPILEKLRAMGYRKLAAVQAVPQNGTRLPSRLQSR